MKIVLIIIFILTACGLFLLLSGILKLPTLRTGRAMMQSGKKEKKLQKTLDAFYMDGAAYLGKYIGMNAYKKSRMQNVLNAAGLKMTPETYMAYGLPMKGKAQAPTQMTCMKMAIKSESWTKLVTRNVV